MIFHGKVKWCWHVLDFVISSPHLIQAKQGTLQAVTNAQCCMQHKATYLNCGRTFPCCERNRSQWALPLPRISRPRMVRHSPTHSQTSWMLLCWSRHRKYSSRVSQEQCKWECDRPFGSLDTKRASTCRIDCVVDSSDSVVAPWQGHVCLIRTGILASRALLAAVSIGAKLGASWQTSRDAPIAITILFDFFLFLSIAEHCNFLLSFWSLLCAFFIILALSRYFCTHLLSSAEHDRVCTAFDMIFQQTTSLISSVRNYCPRGKLSLRLNLCRHALHHRTQILLAHHKAAQLSWTPKNNRFLSVWDRVSNPIKKGSYPWFQDRIVSIHQ
jgi:hypothetical protein